MDNIDGTGSSARFSFLLDIAVDPGGNIYVADTNNHTIRKLPPPATSPPWQDCRESRVAPTENLFPMLILEPTYHGVCTAEADANAGSSCNKAAAC